MAKDVPAQTRETYPRSEQAHRMKQTVRLARDILSCRRSLCLQYVYVAVPPAIGMRIANFTNYERHH